MISAYSNTSTLVDIPRNMKRKEEIRKVKRNTLHSSLPVKNLIHVLVDATLWVDGKKVGSAVLHTPK